MIACQICNAKPSDEPGNVHLERVNEKGVPGIWQCAQGTGCRKFEDLRKKAVVN